MNARVYVGITTVVLVVLFIIMRLWSSPAGAWTS